MKTLFICAVLMATSYLLLPTGFINTAMNSLSQLLPQKKIEQAANTLLVRVDAKLNHLKNEITTEQQQRINVLVKSVEVLEGKLKEQALQLQKVNKISTLMASQAVNNSENKAADLTTNTEEFIVAEQNFAPTQYLEEQILDEQALEDQNFATKNNSAKQLRINRQAKLQDIADRMNNTSLLALTYE